MADRRDIREAAYTEMENAISGLSTNADVTQDDPESLEDLPRVTHVDNYREVPMNQASAAPHEKSYEGGSLAELVFYSMMQAQFTVTVHHHDEQEKETIYEALRRRFERYEHPFWDSTDIHADVHNVDVGDATSDDDPDREPIARGDALIVRLGYKRDYRAVRDDLTNQFSDYDDTFGAGQTIEEVIHELDLGDDGTVDDTYTTT